MFDGTANSDLLVSQTFALLRPPADITVTQWAENNRVLSPENCALPGPYRVAVTPYLKEILDCINDHSIEKVVCQKSAQVAWTDGVINNTVGYYIDHDPASILTLFPTEKMAQRYSNEELLAGRLQTLAAKDPATWTENNLLDMALICSILFNITDDGQ